MQNVDKILKKLIKEKHFRVAIFGSARIQKNNPIFKQTYDLSKMIAENGIDLVTGGGEGLMDAASIGHMAGKNGKKIHTIGLPIKIGDHHVASKHYDLEKRFEKFSDRLDMFMRLTNMILVTPGGIGTCLEFFYSWQLIQVKHICNIPMILIGDQWPPLMKWFKEWPIKKGWISAGDLRNIHYAKDNKQAIEMVVEGLELYKKLGDSYCLNWKKYRV